MQRFSKLHQDLQNQRHVACSAILPICRQHDRANMKNQEEKTYCLLDDDESELKSSLQSRFKLLGPSPTLVMLPPPLVKQVIRTFFIHFYNHVVIDQLIQLSSLSLSTIIVWWSQPKSYNIFLVGSCFQVAPQCPEIKCSIVLSQVI